MYVRCQVKRYPMTVMTYHQAAVYCRHIDGASAPAQESTLCYEQDKGFGCFANRMPEVIRQHLDSRKKSLEECLVPRMSFEGFRVSYAAS